MMSDYVMMALLLLSLLVVFYHHVGYPILLKRLAAAHRKAAAGDEVASPAVAVSQESLPRLTVIVPAHNEAAVIAHKVANLAALKYPVDRLSFVIALDGCTDETKQIAEAAIARAGRDLDFQLVEYKQNRGKIAVLNDLIGAAETDIVALSDASAIIDADAAMRAAQDFADSRVGVVCGTYVLAEAGSEGERKYWEMQTRIKADEAALAAPMGAHGALYFFRRSLWSPIPADTINDDFVLPMRIVADGYRAIYDPSIVATEIERTNTRQEFRRRVRIGAGNMQQLVRLSKLGDPRTGNLAFVFLSGKGMRPLVPFLMLVAGLATAVLAARGMTSFQLLLAAEIAVVGAAVTAIVTRSERLPRLVRWLGYLIEGHAASALGAVSFLTRNGGEVWKPASATGTIWKTKSDEFIPQSVQICKRAFDVVVALLGLAAMLALLPFIAVAIKLDSKGPVFFRQIRVGRSTKTATYLFPCVKFRSMCDNAEAKTGPAYAKADDARITRVGKILRKTRLDELPQFWNVLMGHMSIVGPRPERPHFVAKLDKEFPFYTERTCGLRPGITGLAQVNQSYEDSVRDVSTKIAYDHAYVLRLSSWTSWLKTDLWILFRTVYVVFARTGQ